MWIWSVFSETIFRNKMHCVKSIQIWRFFWSVFSHIWTEYGEIKTPYLNTFYAVMLAFKFPSSHCQPNHKLVNEKRKCKHCVKYVKTETYGSEKTHVLVYLTQWNQDISQPAFTCSKLTIETLEHSTKYVQS